MKKLAHLMAILVVLSMPVTSFAVGRQTKSEEPPAPPPLNFAAELANFISLADDVTALRSWYENLSPDEQAAHRTDFDAAVENLDAKETGLFDLIAAQLDEGDSDSFTYLTFETIKGMDPIKARKIFSSLVNKVSQRLNHDYVTSPSDPNKARRARDMQAVRAYIGRGA